MAFCRRPARTQRLTRAYNWSRAIHKTIGRANDSGRHGWPDGGLAGRLGLKDKDHFCGRERRIRAGEQLARRGLAGRRHNSQARCNFSLRSGCLAGPFAWQACTSLARDSRESYRKWLYFSEGARAHERAKPLCSGRRLPGRSASRPAGRPAPRGPRIEARLATTSLGGAGRSRSRSSGGAGDDDGDDDGLENIRSPLCWPIWARQAAPPAPARRKRHRRACGHDGATSRPLAAGASASTPSGAHLRVGPAWRARIDPPTRPAPFAVRSDFRL